MNMKGLERIKSFSRPQQNSVISIEMDQGITLDHVL